MPNKIEIFTQSTTYDNLNPDVLSTYVAAAEAMGDEEVFLLESCAGPEVDCRESILGVGLLATIEFHRDNLSISAPASLKQALQDELDNLLGKQACDNGTGQFSSSEDVWNCVRALNSIFANSKSYPSEFEFGFLACFAYDAASFIEKLPNKIAGDDFPLISLRLFQSYLIVSKTGKARISVTRSKFFPEPQVDIKRDFLRDNPMPNCDVAPACGEITFSISKNEYLEKVHAALEHIRVGDIYQVQIGHEIKVRSSLSPISLYQRLRALNPSPYMFLCSVAGRQLIGASPENYIRLEDKKISMRPIAGTIGKGDPDHHEQAIYELVTSPKERAEHIMLVDLCRNDIARVAQANSLDVESLMAVEEFSHLFHLVSTVTGEIRQNGDVFDLIKATFPAGTMTGAPKIRAMEIIENLETQRRGAYAGAVGLLGLGNYANLALCIRMTTYDAGTYSLRASAGIVADSNPDSEWRETLVKMGAVYKALTDKELVE